MSGNELNLPLSSRYPNQDGYPNADENERYDPMTTAIHRTQNERTFSKPFSGKAETGNSVVFIPKIIPRGARFAAKKGQIWMR
jgi:hypothetical protein